MMSQRSAVQFGALYTPPPSMFSRRDAAGSFAHTLPPMSAIDEQLQRALLPPPLPLEGPHRGDYWVGLVSYSALGGLILAYIVAQVTA